MKEAIDLTISKPEKCEREFQQLICRENNYSPISNDTDFIISDIEYTHKDLGDLRFDLVAAHWPSTTQLRKDPSKMKLCIMEMKYGDSAVKTVIGKNEQDSEHKSAGILKHFSDLVNAQSHFDLMLNEMRIVIQQKAHLGLIRKSKLDDFSEPEKQSERISKIQLSFDPGKELDWYLIIANHKPASQKLLIELRELQNKVKEVNEKAEANGTFRFNVIIAQSISMGYGLYDEGCISLNDYVKKLEGSAG